MEEFHLESPLSIFDELNIDTMAALFNIEFDHMPSCTNLHFSIRSQTVSLILQFSRKFDPLLSYLAVNYLDRFLSTNPFSEEKPWIQRLVGVSCVSLAMKMTKTDVSVADIEHDGGLVFDSQTIQRVEFLILDALKWRMRSVTAFAFINFFISLFKIKDPPSTQALKARATEIILKAQNEIKLLKFKPSIISASALLSASHELFPLQFPCYKKAILSYSFVNKENFLSCYNVVQEIATEGYESVLDIVSSSSTPANVLDLQHCYSSSSTSDNEQSQSNNTAAASASCATATTTTLTLEKDLKRRKIDATSQNNTTYLINAAN